jgi:hypothetical protein
MTKQKVSRSVALLRARIHRFQSDHSLKGVELAELLDVPKSTMHAWMRDIKYPRSSRVGELNSKLDDLDGFTKHRTSETRYKPCVNATPVPKSLETVLPERRVVKPFYKPQVPTVKPTTTERELHWLVEGWRAGEIKRSTDELTYILNRYRKESP